MHTKNSDLLATESIENHTPNSAVVNYLCTDEMGVWRTEGTEVNHFNAV
jgi:hypothetical protein